MQSKFTRHVRILVCFTRHYYLLLNGYTMFTGHFEIYSTPPYVLFSRVYVLYYLTLQVER
jgi:hypothetical protein